MGARCLSVLAFVPLAVIAGSVASVGLIIQRRYRTWCGICVAGLIANLSLNMWWIPSHGALGASYATLLTECFVGLSAWIALRRNTMRGGWTFSWSLVTSSLPLPLLFFLILTCLDLSADLYSMAILAAAVALPAGYILMRGSASVVRKLFESEFAEESG